MFAFDWLADPTAWAGLLTLVVLEIVLGIDNLVFIAILADKLPPRERDRARVTGLMLALAMRLVLLGMMSWLVTLTRPVLVWGPLALSTRDIILLLGGLFLLFKATLELHERLEGKSDAERSRESAAFWLVVLQIVVLDAVFSLDSVITAVGMVDHLSVMMIAVVLAMALMITASRPLTAFVNARPTVVILCLSFLLMIGFSLVADGLGFHIPKGYLYAAIGFSIMIEFFNQVAHRNRDRSLFAGALTLRDRTAEAVLRMLGAGRVATAEAGGEGDFGEPAPEPVFRAEERAMVQGVLDLAERPVRTIMTPRNELTWLDLDESAEEQMATVHETGHHWFPVAHGDLDAWLGLASARDIVADLIRSGQVDTAASLRKPLTVLESLSVLRLMEEFRQSAIQVALVLDEYGSVEGIVTPTDVLEVITGEFAGEQRPVPDAVAESDGSWLFEGSVDLRRVEHVLERRLPGEEEFGTLAGFVLEHLARLPTAGDSFRIDGLEVEVVAMEGPRIQRVRIRPLADPAD